MGKSHRTAISKSIMILKPFELAELNKKFNNWRIQEL